MKQRGFLLLLLSVMALGQVMLALRQSLWADEAFSLAMATGHSVEHPASAADPALGDFVETPQGATAAELRRYLEHESTPAGFGRVLRAVKLSDTSPPLYYLLLNPWTRLAGTSDLGLRLFSVLMSIACVPLLIALGKDLGEERTGWIAGVLFAMAPLSLYYSSEGRMYSLLWLCVIATASATLQLARGEKPLRAGAIWVVASAAGLLTHYYFVFPWAAMTAYLLVAPGADVRWKIALRAALVLLLISPWYAQLGEVLARWRITQDWVHWKSTDYTVVRVLRDSIVRPFSGNGHNLWPRHRGPEIAVLLVFAAAAAWRFWPKRDVTPGRGWLLVWLWFAAAIAGPLVADLARHTYIAEYPRYASAALPAACLLGAWWLSSLRVRSSWIAVGLVILFWSPQLMAIARQRGRGGQQTRDVGRELSVSAGAGDIILVHSIPTGAISIARYCTSSARFAVWVEQLGQRRVPDSIQSLIAGRKRLLLVKLHLVGADVPEAQWLQENTTFVRDHKVGAVSVSEYRPRGTPAFASTADAP